MTSSTSPKADDAATVLPEAAAPVANKKDEATTATPPVNADKK